MDRSTLILHSTNLTWIDLIQRVISCKHLYLLHGYYMCNFIDQVQAWSHCVTSEHIDLINHITSVTLLSDEHLDM
jgi:hypothetical protein